MTRQESDTSHFSSDGSFRCANRWGVISLWLHEATRLGWSISGIENELKISDQNGYLGGPTACGQSLLHRVPLIRFQSSNFGTISAETELLKQFAFRGSHMVFSPHLHLQSHADAVDMQVPKAEASEPSAFARRL